MGLLEFNKLPINTLVVSILFSALTHIIHNPTFAP